MEEYYLHKRNYEIKVGIIAVIALLSMLLGYSWLKDYFNMRSYTTLKISFSSVDDLKPGDAVLVRGVEQGRVKSLEVETDKVVVTVLVKLKNPLREGTRYAVREGDLMGKRQLEILPGSEDKLVDITKVQYGDSTSGLMDLISSLNYTMVEVNSLVDRFSKDNGLIANLEATVASSENVAANANQVILKNSESVTMVMQNLLKTSRELSSIIESNKGSINKSLALAPDVLEKLNKNLDSLEVITGNVIQFSNNLSKGDGSVQKLMNDKEFYQSLMKTSQELESLLKDIKANPKRYFKIKVF
ncbi:MAG TPA: MlaD family protein [Candidatus Cloacimonadota bacterium]|nr:MlaD family protein [Candidatus Cloacimonadota bacterium]HPT71410.1 MlaD family protein [Candidatus Cloacimonadota bacterium]